MFLTAPPFMSVKTPVLTFQTFANDTTSFTASYSFTSQAIGTAASDRYIIVCVSNRNSAGTNSVNSVTVAGTSCTNLTSSEVGSGLCSIWITNSPITTGTTATIDVTMTGSQTCCGIDVYSVIGLASTTPVSTNNTSTDNNAMALTTPSGGVIVGISTQAGTATCTVTGATEHSDRVVDPTNGVAACSASGSSSSIKFDWTSSTNVNACAVSLR